MSFLLICLLAQDPKFVDAFLEAREAKGFAYATARNQVVGFGEEAVPFLKKKSADRSWEVRIIATVMLARIEDPKRFRNAELEFAGLTHPDTFDEKQAGRPHFTAEDAPFLMEQWLKAEGRPVYSKKRRGRVPTMDHRAAFEELAALKSMGMLEPLLPVLEEESPRAEEVARLIVACGKEALPKLKEMSRKGAVATRCIALEALGGYPWEQVGDELKAAAQDNDAWIRSTVARQMARTGSQEARAPLEHMLQTDKDKYVRVAAADGLRLIGPLESLQILIDALDDKTFTVTTAVARALAETGDDKIRLHLREQLMNYQQPEAASLRVWCIRGLAKAKWDGDAGKIAEFLEDESPRVRAEAVRALMQLDPKGMEETVIESLRNDKANAVRLTAVTALAAHASPVAVKALAGMLKVDASTAVRLRILTKLMGLKRPETEPAVLRALKRDSSWKVRRKAAHVAAAFQSDAAIAALRAAAGTDRHNGVRETAETLLKDLPDD